ncbi:MAG: hypothetical protein MAG451_02323 [Anaerolineales bacterium]|nr:hypothetical protein [Anaerolineales bacterium]
MGHFGTFTSLEVPKQRQEGDQWLNADVAFHSEPVSAAVR